MVYFSKLAIFSIATAFAAAAPAPQSSSAPIAGYLVLIDPSSGFATACVGEDGKFDTSIQSAACEATTSLTQVDNSLFILFVFIIFANIDLDNVTLTTSAGNCGLTDGVFVCGAGIPVTVFAVSLNFITNLEFS
jgi:hypothetical protein